MKRETKLCAACLLAFALLAAPVIWTNGSGLHCSVHRMPLQRGWAHVSYGLAVGIAAPIYLFPNANTSRNGGCSEPPFAPPYEGVEFCPQCREEQRRWFAAHPAPVSFALRHRFRQQNSQWFRTHKATY